MTTSQKKIIKAGLLALVFSAQGLFAQSDELQTTIHNRVEERDFSAPQGDRWQAEKKVLAKYSQDRIVRALIAEIDLDRGERLDNKLRDITIFTLVQTLKLPPGLFCQELDKSESPQRKASLMYVLRGQKDQVVIQALLRQLKDKRPGLEIAPMLEGHPHALRVCDEACNALVECLNGKPGGDPISIAYKDEHRDEIIQKVLTRYKLNVPE